MAVRHEITLTPTGKVILGMVGIGKATSGYDIKQLVDKSTRHFWAASYAQIYPELRRLEEHGLLVGTSAPTGGRARTEYELTDAGRSALLDWLRSDDEPLDELRDEGLLKLFFSDAIPEQQLEIVRSIRAQAERKLAALEAIGTPPHPGPALTLSLGTAVAQTYIEWCEAAERRLARKKR